MTDSRITPPVTWAPWKPVIVKKQEANRLTLGRKWPVALMPGGIMVADHQLIIFVDLDAQEARADQDGGQQEDDALAPACRPESPTRARTIVTDEQIRMNVLAAVRLMASGLVSSS